MLSVASLSAFSGAISPAQPTPVRLPFGSGAPSSTPAPIPQTPAVPQASQSGDGTQPPSRMLPRGSLLDLSI